MKNIEEFKSFVKTKPSLITYVKNGDMTWQKFYELWSLYGADHEVWNGYKPKEEEPVEPKKAAPNSINDFVGLFKNVNMDDLRKGVSGLQEALGLIGGMFAGGASKNTSAAPTREPYTPRSLFRRFED